MIFYRKRGKSIFLKLCVKAGQKITKQRLINLEAKAFRLNLKNLRYLLNLREQK